MVPTRKAARKSGPRRRPRKKSRAKPVRRKAVKTVAVGDAVRLLPDARNQISRYDPSVALGARAPEAIEGIICSIRAIATGKLVGKTRGDLAGYVLEILHDQTFRPGFSSNRNTGGPRGSERVQDNPSWGRLRALLQDMASKKQLISAASGGLSDEPFGSLLDGWRIVKVQAELVEPAK